MEPKNTPDQVIVADELVTDTGIFDHYDLSLIRISKTNRTRFNQDALDRLAVNIAAVGVVQPILIRHVTPTDAEPQIYEVVAGERRYRASIIAGMRTIPALLRTLTGLQAAEIQLIENIQREDPHPMEEADGYQQLMLTHGYTADQLADKINKSRSYIYGRLKLCALALDVREQFLDNKIPASTALLIARMPAPSLQTKALAEITSSNYASPGEPMSYRLAADLIQRRFMLDLAHAPFSPMDATLVASAGACSKCPKRTGNQPEIYVDAKSADVCTDPDCYAEKRAANDAQTIAEAEKKGICIYEGKEAETILNSHVYVYDGLPLYNFGSSRIVPGHDQYRPIRELLEPFQLPTPFCYTRTLHTPLTARYDRNQMKAALQAAGVLEKDQMATERTMAPANGERDAEKKAQVARVDATYKAAAEITERRVALYKRLREKGSTGFSLESLREITKLALLNNPLPSDLLGEIYSFDASSDQSVADYIEQAGLPEVQLILVDLLIGETLHVNSYDLDKNNEIDYEDQPGYSTLENMAKAEGIDQAPPTEEVQDGPIVNELAVNESSTRPENEMYGDYLVLADFETAPPVVASKPAKKSSTTTPKQAKTTAKTPGVPQDAPWPFPKSDATAPMPPDA